MKCKFKVLLSLTVLLLVGSINFANAQVPVSKPQRSSSTQQTKPKQTQNRKQVVSGTINGHDYVDIGLSVKWATCNVGASKPSGYGNYYAWGETSKKSSFTADNSKWFGVKYAELQSKNVVDSLGNLQSQYDVAQQNWGSSWRLPTLREIEELINSCTWTWTSEDGHRGYRVMGPNDNSIFIPAAGSIVHGDSYGPGTYGYYWSATFHNSYDQAFFLSFSPYAHYTNRSLSDGGQSIRPVTN